MANQYRFVDSGLGLATINLHATFEVSIYYEYMKGDKKSKNFSGLGLGVIQRHCQHNHSIE